MLTTARLVNWSFFKPNCLQYDIILFFLIQVVSSIGSPCGSSPIENLLTFRSVSSSTVPVSNQMKDSCTTPPSVHPLLSKQQQQANKEVKHTDSQSTPSQSDSPVQLTPIPLSTCHQRRFVFPEVTICDTGSGLSLPETHTHNSCSEVKDTKDSTFDGCTTLSRDQEQAAFITPVTRKRKISAISLEMDPILEEDGELSSSSCMVDDDLETHSSACTAYVDSAYIDSAHPMNSTTRSPPPPQVPTVKIETTTMYSNAHHPKTETLYTTQAVTYKPKMVTVGEPQSDREDTLHNRPPPPPVVTTTPTDDTHVRGHTDSDWAVGVGGSHTYTGVCSNASVQSRILLNAQTRMYSLQQLGDTESGGHSLPITSEPSPAMASCPKEVCVVTDHPGSNETDPTAPWQRQRGESSGEGHHQSKTTSFPTNYVKHDDSELNDNQHCRDALPTMTGIEMLDEPKGGHHTWQILALRGKSTCSKPTLSASRYQPTTVASTSGELVEYVSSSSHTQLQEVFKQSTRTRTVAQLHCVPCTSIQDESSDAYTKTCTTFGPSQSETDGGGLIMMRKLPQGSSSRHQIPQLPSPAVVWPARASESGHTNHGCNHIHTCEHRQRRLALGYSDGGEGHPSCIEMEQDVGSQSVPGKETCRSEQTQIQEKDGRSSWRREGECDSQTSEIMASLSTWGSVPLKVKEDECDNTSGKGSPIPIRVVADNCTTSRSHAHEPEHACTCTCAHACTCAHSKASGHPSIYVNKTLDRNRLSACCGPESSTPYRVEDSANELPHDPNDSSDRVIHYHGNAGSGVEAGEQTARVYGGNQPHKEDDDSHKDTDGHVDQYTQALRLRPKTVAVLHKTASKLTQSESPRLQHRSCVGDQLQVQSKQNDDCKVDLHSMAAIPSSSTSSSISKWRNRDQVTRMHQSFATQGTNNHLTTQGIQLALSVIPDQPQIKVNTQPANHPHPVRPVNRLVPVQRKPPGMHIQCNLPTPCSQESDQTTRKAINSAPTKNGDINHNTTTATFHAQNCPSHATSPSAGHTTTDYAYMTTCSKHLVAAKPKSLKPVSELHAKDRPLPIKYMQTDI